MVQAGTAYIDFEGRYDKLYRQTDSAMANVGRSASRAAGQATSAWSGVGNAIGTAVNTAAVSFTAVSAASAAALTSVVRTGIEYNSLNQRARAALETVLGTQEASAQMMDQITEFARSSPFPRQVFIEATQQMLAFGYAAEDVVPTLGAIEDAVAAAGGSSQQIKEVVFVLSQIQSSGRITGQDLLQLGQRGINAAELIGNSLGQTGEQVKASISEGTLDAGTALQALTTGMEASFGGAAENVKNTWVGATDRVKGALRDIGSAIVEPFIATSGGGYAVEWANTVADALRGLEAAVKPIVDALVDRLQPFLESVGPYLQAFTDWISSIDAASVTGFLDKFSEFLPIIGSITSGLGTMGASSILGAFGPLAGIAGMLNPAVAAIAGLVLSSEEGRGALQGLFDAIMPVVTLLGDALEPILATLQPILTTIVELVGEFAAEFISALAPSLEEFLPPLLEVVTVLGDGLLQILEAVRPILPELAVAMGGALGGALEAMVPILGELVPIIGLLADILAVIVPIWVRFQVVVWTVYGVFTKAIWTVIAAVIGGIADAVRGAAAGFAWLGRVLKPVASMFADLFSGDFSGAWERFKNVGSDLGHAIWNGLVAAFNWIVTQLGPALGRILTGIWNWITGTALPAIGQAFLTIVPAALGWIAAVVVGLTVELPKILAYIAGWIIGAAAAVLFWFVTSFVPAAYQWIWDVITGLPGQLWGIAQAIWGWITGTAVPAVIGFFTEMVPAALGWIWNVVTNLPSTLANILTAFGTWITETAVPAVVTKVGEITTAFFSWITDTVTGLPEKLGEIWTTLKEWLEGLVEDVKDLGGDIGGALVDGIKGGVGDIAGGLVGGITSGFGLFASGGLITKPTLGLVGEAGPELVLPLNDPTRMQQLLAAHFPGFTAFQAGGAVGGAPAAGGEAGLAWQADNTVLAAWAEEAAAIFARLGLTIELWAYTSAAALRQWANVDVPTATIPAMNAWSTQMGSIFTTMAAQIAATMTGLANNVASILSTAGNTWRTIADLAAYNVVLAITTRLYAAIAQITAIVQGYATALAGGLNPILQSIGQQPIRLADGAVVAYAKGGINGRDRSHIAQIAPAGAWRVWAEPETGGEAYIPLASSKRGRSKAITEDVVRRFGGQVDWFAGGGVTGNAAGLNGEFLRRVTAWAAAVGQAFHITSGYRDINQQRVLYARYLAGTGNLAARPGSSMHNFGLAIDGPHWGNRGPSAFGLVYSVRGEPWHVEPVEARQWAHGMPAAGWGDSPGVSYASLPAPPAMPWTGAVSDTAAKAMTYVYEKATAWASEQLASSAGGFADAGLDTATLAGGDARAMGQQMAAARGWTGAAWNALNQLWQKESGWKVNADNPTSSAYGIPQALPGSKMASHGADWRTNAATQIAWGLDYIAQRYGSPLAAWAHSQRLNWYGTGGLAFIHRHDFDRGGVLRPGANLVQNNTGRDEHLVPAGQGSGPAVAITEAHFHEGVDYDMFLRKTAYMVRAGRL